MTGDLWLAGGALVAAALASWWPASRLAAARRLPAGAGRVPGASVVAGLDRTLRRLPAPSPVVGGVAGVAALLVGGPVAGMAAAAYVTALAVGWRRHRADRDRSRQRRAALDALAALAADLRAGLPPSAAAGIPGAAVGPWRSPGGRRLGELAGAAARLADATGAPLADLVERIEADARAMDRATTAAAAQAAGAQATAWLLAALPLGGIALGYGIGVDPLQVLFHSPYGAACAVSAVLLQLAGLAWADRLVRAPLRGAGEGGP
jgi:tight adherence protein B